MLPREFVCIDCKAHVFRYRDEDVPLPRRLRCYNCALIRHLELAPEEEAELRRMLDCELREKADDDG